MVDASSTADEPERKESNERTRGEERHHTDLQSNRTEMRINDTTLKRKPGKLGNRNFTKDGLEIFTGDDDDNKLISSAENNLYEK